MAIKGPFNYMVFGFGRVGQAVVYDLIENCNAKKVFVFDPDICALKDGHDWLTPILGEDIKKIKVVFRFPKNLLKKMDIIISCAPFSANLDLARRALDAGVPFCDLGGNPEVVEKQKEMAGISNVPVVPDCGVAPGLANIIAVHFVKVFGCKSIEIRCGGNPYPRPNLEDNPLQYKLLFSVEGLISEYSGFSYVVKNGGVETVRALGEKIWFDANGYCFEAFPTSNNSKLTAKYLKDLGVLNYDYMTLRYAGHFQEFLELMKGRSREELKAILESDGSLVFNREEDEDILVLSVEGVDRLSDFERKLLSKKHSWYCEVRSDPKTKFTAMEMMTAWGINIVAEHIVYGRGEPTGFSLPEQFVDTKWVIEKLEKRIHSF